MKSSPSKNQRKDSNDHGFDIKKKNEIIDIVNNDPREWGKYCKSINFDKHFNNKAKELRFNELLHVHYVLNKPKKEQPLHKSIDHEFRVKEFSDRHHKGMVLFRSKIDEGALESSMRKIKRIYPYTSSGRTVIKVMENCFPNMTCPITQPVTCKDYSVKKLRHMESLGMIQYEEDNRTENSSDIWLGINTIK
jgi:hypothetical protein